MALSRRALLLGGAVAAVAVPAGLHLSWGARDFTRKGFVAEPPPAPPGRVNWSNWSGIQRATPRAIVVAKDEASLRAAMLEGAAPIRPVGSGHSFAPLVPSEGTIIDISPMAGIISEDKAAGTVTFVAGTRLQHAARLLAERGLAFANLPDITTQTFGGMFSTATHGTGLLLPPIHDHIVGFRIMLPNGEMREATVNRDPDLFAAGKVSLGALGVITQYVIKPVPAFNLRRKLWTESIETLVPRIDVLARQHRNFEFYYLPATGKAAAIVHDVHTGAISGREPSTDDATVASLKDLRDSLGWWPWLRGVIADQAIPDGQVEDSTDESWKLLATGRPIKFNEMEYELPIESGTLALKEALAAADAQKNLFFPIEVRLTAGDTAWLSPFSDGPRMSISIHTAADEDVDFLYTVFEPIFRKHGGRPHWGKLHSLKRDDFGKLYPKFDAFAALRKTLDPQGRMLNPFLTELFGA
jgi:FAD-linked oxidoreductase